RPKNWMSVRQSTAVRSTAPASRSSRWTPSRSRASRAPASARSAVSVTRVRHRTAGLEARIVSGSGSRPIVRRSRAGGGATRTLGVEELPDGGLVGGGHLETLEARHHVVHLLAGDPGGPVRLAEVEDPQRLGAGGGASVVVAAAAAASTAARTTSVPTRRMTPGDATLLGLHVANLGAGGVSPRS